MKRNAQHIAKRTVLVVGEGYAELAFLRHLKSLYVQRASGVAVTIKNAYGKGAQHVVDVAIRQSRNAQFDVVAALLDADTDWHEKTQALARKHKVQVVAAEPCLEALLLGLHGAAVAGKTTAQLKLAFGQRFGAPASESSIYAPHFQHALIEQRKQNSAPLAKLINLMCPGA
ncbi:MAG: hypothetical protein ACKVIH_12260 [Burkholderiales bacterium]